MSGEKCDLSNDKNILSITSPQNNVKGPYKVVYKNIDEKWAIVALDWNDYPSLAIRWFWGTMGNPISSGYPTWFTLPSELEETILNGLPLDYQVRKKVEKFLTGEITGEQLKTDNKTPTHCNDKK
jgi:hypothetical protein